MTGYADTLIEGRVLRGFREGFAEAPAVAGNRIVACGTREAVRALAGPGTRRDVEKASPRMFPPG